MESKKIFFSDRLIKTGKKVEVKGKGKGTLFPYIFHFFNWKCVALDDGKVEERQRVVGQISRGGVGWTRGNRLAVVEPWRGKRGCCSKNGRMNQEFPYVIAAIIASSNWCRRSLGRWWSHPWLVAITKLYFLFIFLHVRDVERLKRHKLERYFAADAGVARVSAIWSSNFALFPYCPTLPIQSNQIVKLFIDFLNHLLNFQSVTPVY